VPADGYYNTRQLARDHLAPRGIEVREVPTKLGALRTAVPGARLVWVETPSNPTLDVVDLPALAQNCREAGALLAVDSTVATPLRVRPLAAGADFVVASATKALTGHSDVLLGYVAARQPAMLDTVRAWRGAAGAIPGPFEAWLAHRSLATYAVRLERQERNAGAVAELLRARDDVSDVRWPAVGSVVCFTLASAERAQAFFAASALVSEATSFGGLHTSGERRARWGTDDVAEGWIRFSAGIEDTEDLLADITAALDGV
jgi:cystathionine gamma-lyase